jgi:ABC-type transport system involved in multi-copper enzyme maturation permease subunit
MQEAGEKTVKQRDEPNGPAGRITEETSPQANLVPARTTGMVEFLVIGGGLLLLQIAAALPWIGTVDPVAFKAWWRRALSSVLGLQVVGGVLVGVVAVLFIFHEGVTDPEQLKFWGEVYGSILQAQLSADLFVLTFVVLLRLWPHGGAVALAAFREGIRQPMFWLLTIGALFLPMGGLLWMPLLPYFTFGEDIKMMKELGFDLIMLVSTAFGVIAASMSISEEIEGKTAVTVMSKPVSRRQFLLGKFIGVFLAALAMTLLLGWFFSWVLYFKEHWDPTTPVGLGDVVPDPQWVTEWIAGLNMDMAASEVLRGMAVWGSELAMTSLGLVIGAGQLMILLAIAVALATRLPMIVNLVVCLVVFFLGHLTPILLAVSQGKYRLVQFTAQLFDTILPGLEFFDMGPAVVRDTPLPLPDFAAYVGSVTAYSLLYTTIALFFGLILFEDRDLA